MNFLQRIGRLLTRPEHSASGGLGGFGGLSFWRGGFDYKAEAGPLYESSIPLACLKWEQRASIEAEIVPQRRNENGDWENDHKAPVNALLGNPNPFFDTHQLLDALRFDYHLDGNAYLLKARSGSGKVVQLWWIPSWMIEPRWKETGEEFISCYEYSVNGKLFAIPTEDIIHFRNGIDPRSHGRKGLSDFAAVLREVCSDNEASVFQSSVLRNMGIPGVVVSPKGGGDVEMNSAQRQQFKEMWQESFTGERRGEPFVQGIPVDITVPSFSPQQMVFDKIRRIPEERITAAFGIPAVVLGLGAGLETSSAKSSHADAREQAYESCIIPTLYSFARTLTRQLMCEFDCVLESRIWFDLSEVRVLQADENALYKRLSLAWESGWITRAEARGAAGYQSTPEDDVYNERENWFGTAASVLRDETEREQPERESEQAGFTEEELKTFRQRLALMWRRGDV